MTALIGLDNIAHLENVEKRNISAVVIHEEFKSTAVRDENDIAVATLSAPVTFSDTIIPICLPDPGEICICLYNSIFFKLVASLGILSPMVIGDGKWTLRGAGLELGGCLAAS